MAHATAQRALREATITPLQTEVRFLRPDVAVVRWTWNIAGDRNLDGTLRPPRYGLMTMVAEKRNNAWLVVVSQNDNSGGPVPNEIKGPMPIPDQFADHHAHRRGNRELVQGDPGGQNQAGVKRR
jgi:hypothetical protein